MKSSCTIHKSKDRKCRALHCSDEEHIAFHHVRKLAHDKVRHSRGSGILWWSKSKACATLQMLDALDDSVGWIAVVAHHAQHLLFGWVAEVEVQTGCQLPAFRRNARRKVWKADVCGKSKKRKVWGPLVLILVAWKLDLLHGAEHEECYLTGFANLCLGNCISAKLSNSKVLLPSTKSRTAAR